MIEPENLNFWILEKWRLKQRSMGPGNMEAEGLESFALEKKLLVLSCPWARLLQRHWCAQSSLLRVSW
jgi:hypothetical protein